AGAGGLRLRKPVKFTGHGWQFSHHGVFGGLVHAVAFDPSQPGVAWAGAAGGIYRSSDNGRTWTITSGDFRDWVDCLIVDPATSDVFACSGRGWVTRDGGAHWESIITNDVVTGM